MHRDRREGRAHKTECSPSRSCCMPAQMHSRARAAATAAPPRRGQHETRRGNDRATRIHPHWRYGWRDDLRGGAGGIVPASVAKSRTTANVDTRCAFSSRQCKSLRKAHGCARPVRRRNASLMTPRLHVLSPPVPHWHVGPKPIPPSEPGSRRPAAAASARTLRSKPVSGSLTLGSDRHPGRSAMSHGDIMDNP